MKLRKSVLFCGIVSAMIVTYVFTMAVKEDRCWYSTLHHYKTIITTYARQIFT